MRLEQIEIKKNEHKLSSENAPIKRCKRVLLSINVHWTPK